MSTATPCAELAAPMPPRGQDQFDTRMGADPRTPTSIQKLMVPTFTRLVRRAQKGRSDAPLESGPALPWRPKSEGLTASERQKTPP
jgi:hypothetical protein